MLYVLGELDSPETPAVAIVGTRGATSYGKMAAEQLARGLAAAGVTVVSGLAMGVDAAAHRGSLDGGGRTIAVLGNGLDRVYPANNARLAQQIAQQGALVTEFPLGTKPDAMNFPRRNRIISGLSSGTLVVEAGERSGALITAAFATDQGRDVLAVFCHAGLLCEPSVLVIIAPSYPASPLSVARTTASVAARRPRYGRGRQCRTSPTVIDCGRSGYP